MTKYIHYNYYLRCRLKSTFYGIELQLQENTFWGWKDVWQHMQVSERQKNFIVSGLSDFTKIETTTGVIHECYDKGTLDIEKRVQAFFQEYFEYLEKK